MPLLIMMALLLLSAKDPLLAHLPSFLEASTTTVQDPVHRDQLSGPAPTYPYESDSPPQEISVAENQAVDDLSAPPLPSKLGEDLYAALTSTQSSGRFYILLRLTEPEVFNLEPTKKRMLIAQMQDLVAAAIRAHGGVVTYRCTNLWCLDADVPKEAIWEIAAMPEVTRIDLDHTEQ